MLHTMQALHTYDSEEVAAYSTDARSHLVEHVAKLLDIRFTSCIIDCRCSLGKHCRHNYIGSTRH